MPDQQPPLGDSIGWKSQEISTMSSVSESDVKKAKELVDAENQTLSEILDAKES